VKETKLELGSGCNLVITEYGPDVSPDLTLDYIEYSTDHWHSDSETSIDIGIQKAVDIIEFLKKVYDI